MRIKSSVELTIRVSLLELSSLFCVSKHNHKIGFLLDLWLEVSILYDPDQLLRHFDLVRILYHKVVKLFVSLQTNARIITSGIHIEDGSELCVNPAFFNELVVKGADLGTPF